MSVRRLDDSIKTSGRNSTEMSLRLFINWNLLINYDPTDWNVCEQFVSIIVFFSDRLRAALRPLRWYSETFETIVLKPSCKTTCPLSSARAWGWPSPPLQPEKKEAHAAALPTNTNFWWIFIIIDRNDFVARNDFVQNNV